MCLARSLCVSEMPNSLVSHGKHNVEKVPSLLRGVRLMFEKKRIRAHHICLQQDGGHLKYAYNLFIFTSTQNCRGVVSQRYCIDFYDMELF